MNEAEMVAKVEKFVQENGTDNPIAIAHGIGMLDAFMLCNTGSDNKVLKGLKLKYLFDLMKMSFSE